MLSAVHDFPVCQAVRDDVAFPFTFTWQCENPTYFLRYRCQWLIQLKQCSYYTSGGIYNYPR